MPDYFIGIDGGGTSCRAAVATASGEVLGRAKSGSANIFSDLDVAAANIVDAATRALLDAGLDAAGLTEAKAFLGLAGGNIESAVAGLKSRLPFRRAIVASDGLIALQGALGGEDGVVAILGTGSLFMTRQDGKLRYRGGWGFIVSDHGSGARIGRALIEECLFVHDGVRGGSDLIAQVLADFGSDPTRLAAFAKTASPADFGRFAPMVFAAAEAGDEGGIRIVEPAAAFVDEMLAASVFEDCPTLCLLGGLAERYPAFLAPRYRQLLKAPKGDALSGALGLAIESFGAEAKP